MNWVDVLIIIALLVATFLGLKKGLIKTLIPMVGLIVAIPLAGTMYGSLAEHLGFINSESWANIAAFAIILVAIFLAFYVVAMMLQKIAKVLLLGWVDRLGGAAFGFIIAWLITSVLIALVARYAALPTNLPDISVMGKDVSIEDQLHLDGLRRSTYNTIDGSTLATFQIDSFPVILGLLPDKFDPIRDFFED